MTTPATPAPAGAALIQFVPFVVSGPAGQAAQLAERCGRLATAWLQAHQATYVSSTPTSNLVVSISDQTSFFYTLLLVARVPGPTPAPWGDPSEPAEWRALGTPLPAAAQAPPPARPAPAAPAPAVTAPAAPAHASASAAGDGATEKQLGAIFAIARRRHQMDDAAVAAYVAEGWHCAPAALSRKTASEVIDALQEMP